jgi:FixJ family two-component response regulator
MNPVAPLIRVIDDDASFALSIARLLGALNYQVRTHPSVGAFLLEFRRDQPCVLILDISLPGPSGLELQEALSAEEDAPPIIFLTGNGDIPKSVQAIKSGAIDFLTKPVKRDALLAAIQCAIEQEAAARTDREKARSIRRRYDLLTPRERQVLARVVAGKLNKQIAADLGTTERTVKAHRAQVMAKMEVQSIAELVHLIDAAGHLEPSRFAMEGAALSVPPSRHRRRDVLHSFCPSILSS